MKHKSLISAFLFAMCLWSITLQAQDDVYYYPQGNTTQTTTQQTDQNGNTYITNNYYNTDDEYVNYEDETYDYYYQSRLRRFHSPVAGFDYFGGYYTDRFWYGVNDPFWWGYSIYDNPWAWSPAMVAFSPRPWFRPRVIVSWGWGGGWGWNNWGWNNWGWNSPWASPWGVNNWGWYNSGWQCNAWNNGWYANNWYGGWGWGYSPFSPVTYVHNDITIINTNNNTSTGYYYGPRGDRSSSGNGTGYGDRGNAPVSNGFDSGKTRGNDVNTWSDFDNAQPRQDKSTDRNTNLNPYTPRNNNDGGRSINIEPKEKTQPERQQNSPLIESKPKEKQPDYRYDSKPQTQPKQDMKPRLEQPKTRDAAPKIDQPKQEKNNNKPPKSSGSGFSSGSNKNSGSGGFSKPSSSPSRNSQPSSKPASSPSKSNDRKSPR
ncbi:MAG TPA: hypothetical protein PK239_12610 [Chitinophagales bacterium]|nr:hypothetical protein [Chitinophagales bacterium]